jgi:hypothetical protein
MRGMNPKTPPPWDHWARALRAVEEALQGIEIVYRGDPALPQYLDLLHRKRREFRDRIRSLVERN